MDRLHIGSPGIDLWENNISQLWCDVCAIITMCVKADSENRRLSPNDECIYDYFNFSGAHNAYNKKFVNLSIDSGEGSREVKVENPYSIGRPGKDNHLQLGMFKTHHVRSHQYPRIAQLTIDIYYREKHYTSDSTIVIPSPLSVIYAFLTAPENPCTAAYALSACRNWLSSVLNIWPGNNEDKEAQQKKSSGVLTLNDLESSMESFRSFIKIGARWPQALSDYSSMSTIEKFGKVETFQNYMGNFLATRGFANLSLSVDSAVTENKGKKKADTSAMNASDFLRFDSVELLEDRYHRSGVLEKEICNRLRRVYFRKSQRYETVPEDNEFVNQIFGFPLPIKGLDVVFNGGLHPSHSGGLVVSLSGKPGTGKTSFSLALSDAFAPFGTATFFMSLEETKQDVLGKLRNIRPDFVDKLSVCQESDKSFFCYRPDDGFEFNIGSFAEKLSEFMGRTKVSLGNVGSSPGYCPAIVVIDNLNMLLGDNPFSSDKRNNLKFVESIIRECRSVNAITILVSAQNVPSEYRIDYLSDIVIEMGYDDLGSLNSKPVRVFNLTKTRHQLARQGSHVFHMTGGKGFRIVPHMDSLMDKKEIAHRVLPKKDQYVHALNYKVSADGKVASKKYLDIYPSSNILIHGFGSGGKAGFALKILMTPPTQKKTLNLPILKDSDLYNSYMGEVSLTRRILIISFLYPEEYYEELIFGSKSLTPLHERLEESIFGEKSGRNVLKPIVDYMVFYPGYLSPQDFLNKVVVALDQAKLEGKPFTGVLIDGLHNVFLQYEKLQKSNMVWATLYSILSRYDFTVVSTFTNFSLQGAFNNGGSINQSNISDQSLIQEGMAPFLHALVKATDFYLYLQEEVSETNERIYTLSVKSAIGQKIPDTYLEWDRGKLEFVRELDVKNHLRRLRGDKLEDAQ